MTFGAQNEKNVDCILFKFNMLHSISFQSVHAFAICNHTHNDNAPECRPLLTENIRNVDVGRAFYFVKVHY